MNILGNKDFTLSKYEKLCRAIVGSNYSNVTMAEYFVKRTKHDNRFIILRHDVDESCINALDIASKEFEIGLKSTYYFRIKRKTYIPGVIDKIAGYGHEIGYHYETVDRCHGDLDLAIKLFQDELSILRQRYPVYTACMHGNPLTKYDNKDIWKKQKITDFGLVAEPYLSLDYCKFAYFSDSGRTWGSNTWRKTKDNIQQKPLFVPKDTEDLIRIIKSGDLGNICILTHPERWSKNIMDYSRRYLIDLAYLAGKTVIHKIRKK